MKKRTVILFGAGAAIPWGGPTTHELTQLILNDDPLFICNDNKTLVTQQIHNILFKNGYEENNINFETIINVIDELIFHHSLFQLDKEISTLQRIFYQFRFQDDFSNYSIKGKNKKHTYRLDIPRNKQYSYSLKADSNIPEEQLYFMNLLRHLIVKIEGRILDYAQHSKILSNDHSLNSVFQNWINKLAEKGTVRMYNLNYDRIFQVLSENTHLDIFEGFEGGSECLNAIDAHPINPDIKRIVTDYESHIHYNLHGSIYWKILEKDPYSQLNNPHVVFHKKNVLIHSEDEAPILQFEKGKNILLTNIVTGYQKAQRSFMSPIRQMQASFDRDCLMADEIWIIGYSLGDAHINSSIKTALQFNSNIKINFIDPAYKGNEGYLKSFAPKLIYILPEYLREKAGREYQDERLTIAFKGKLRVISDSFNDFLKDPI